ncbi:initiator tRNA phosphoribosyl transferase [Myriangium duriaei CBS 260.36]|uniref:Initiator tRNA phosphoribosyl transferase n=1 Tax=Myriangium duriaei CBS 260.36 TaxID=1168546 RepID=A0A9P4JFC9_9PEZI|nr:initiator tRNA phosphoribosyl transferase [Myriangium duriaei CBS 260.36]
MSTTTSDPDLANILFPSASRSISTFVRASTRSRLSIRSRLASIAADAQFATSISDITGLPLVANERCGSWYVPPPRKAGGVYFKSTDGHFGQWRFSARRLNVQLLGIVRECGGCVIVDSTRRGKSVPDALAKTVPVWAAVWNALLFPERADVHGLRTPEDVVGRSEHAQIEARLDGFVAELRALEVEAELDKPLRPVWVTQASMHRLEAEVDEARRDGYPLVLCTASGKDVGDVALPEGCDYVQGAADDAEAWACGLTPELFWAKREELLHCDEDGLPDLIGKLVEEAQGTTEAGRNAVRIEPTRSVWVGTDYGASGQGSYDMIIDMRPVKDQLEQDQSRGKTLASPFEPGKLGSRALRRVLPSILDKVGAALATNPKAEILIACATGKDFSVGVALALICMFASDDGQMTSQPRTAGIDKEFIRKRLGWIMVCIPDANPSRATLQSVNAVLLA